MGYICDRAVISIKMAVIKTLYHDSPETLAWQKKIWSAYWRPLIPIPPAVYENPVWISDDFSMERPQLVSGMDDNGKYCHGMRVGASWLKDNLTEEEFQSYALERLLG